MPIVVSVSFTVPFTTRSRARQPESRGDGLSEAFLDLFSAHPRTAVKRYHETTSTRHGPSPDRSNWSIVRRHCKHQRHNERSQHRTTRCNNGVTHRCFPRGRRARATLTRAARRPEARDTRVPAHARAPPAPPQPVARTPSLHRPHGHAPPASLRSVLALRLVAGSPVSALHRHSSSWSGGERQVTWG